MEELLDFFQGSLVKDFGLDDDRVMELLHDVIEDLRRVKMDVPPKGDEALENPTRPLGVFVPPTIEQLISTAEDGKDEIVTESDKRGGAQQQRPNIPADGGPVVLPSPLAKRMSRIGSGRFSPSVEDANDAVTDGASSHASAVEYQSSRTSMVDSLSEAACFNASGSSEVPPTGEKTLPDRLVLTGVDNQRRVEESWQWIGLSEAPSSVDYEAILANSRLQEEEFRRTLEDLPEEVEVLGRTGRPGGRENVLLHLYTPPTPTLGSMTTLQNSGFNSVAHSPNGAWVLDPSGAKDPRGKLDSLPTPTELRELDDLLKELGLDDSDRATVPPRSRSDPEKKTNGFGKASPRPNSSSDVVNPVALKDAKPYDGDLRGKESTPRRTSVSAASAKSSGPSAVFTPIPILHLRSVPTAAAHLSPPLSAAATRASHGSGDANGCSTSSAGSDRSSPSGTDLSLSSARNPAVVSSGVSSSVSSMSSPSSGTSSAVCAPPPPPPGSSSPSSASPPSLSGMRLRRPLHSILTTNKGPSK